MLPIMHRRVTQVMRLSMLRACVSSQCVDEAEHAKGMCQQCVAEPALGSAGSVRMIRSAHDAHEGIEIEVIVDSGADASCCLPQSLSTAGACSGSPVEFIQDAQGNCLIP